MLQTANLKSFVIKHRKVVVASFAIALLIASAVGYGVWFLRETPAEPADEIVYESEPPAVVPEVIIDLPLILGQQQFLEDLDYLLYTLENNFALFDVAYWARETDIYAVIEDIRRSVIDAPDMTVDEFFLLFHRHFDRQNMGGSLRVISPARYHNPAVTSSMLGSARYGRTNRRRFNYPHVQAFYWGRGRIDQRLEHYSEAARNYWITYISLHGLTDEAEEIRRLLDDGMYYEATLLVDAAFDYIDVNPLPLVYTEIIEPGRIGYLQINGRQPPLSERMRIQIFDFFEEIQGYEHLIIDLRTIAGYGYATATLINYIFRPIFADEIELEGFAFLRYGYYVSENGEIHPRRWFNYTVPMLSRERGMRPAEEIIAGYYIPELRLADMERMEYGFRTRVTLGESRWTQFDYGSAFDGNIWLLTSPIMASGAEFTARVMKNQGIATLVGERTGGQSGGPMTFFPLPNTGILFEMYLFYMTDEFGRPFDAGTYPHHFNRDSYDALETALMLIAEGAY